MEKGQIVEMIIEDISDQGMGIGKADGFTVFVNNVVPGDRVRATLTKVKKNYAFGRTEEILEMSKKRVEPFCPYFGQCGGCVYGNVSYEAQLKIKEKQVRDKLQRLGGLEEPITRPIVGMAGFSVTMDENSAGNLAVPGPFRYRNKAEMPVSTGGLITRKGGIAEPIHEPRIGFFRSKTHNVVDCRDCLLQAETAVAAADALRKFMEEDHIISYDPRWEKGLMRHLIVRTAMGTGEVMVILVVNGKTIPNVQKLVTLLDDAISAIPAYEEGSFKGREFSLESVVINVNKKKTSQILGDECITVAGKPTITEEAGGLTFEISPLSFYQVNSYQMVGLYEKVLEYADLKGDETVLDLYCGVGTIGLFAAKDMLKKGGKGMVVGIESVKGAVLDANRNAVLNGIVNARYILGKAEEELPKLVGMVSDEVSSDDDSLKISKAHVAILDPPRAGCDERLLEATVAVSPEKIVYVSCDPATMARDVKWLTQNGYDFVEATPWDMFPWTGAVETVALLRRKKACFRNNVGYL